MRFPRYGAGPDNGMTRVESQRRGRTVIFARLALLIFGLPALVAVAEGEKPHDPDLLANNPAKQRTQAATSPVSAAEASIAKAMRMIRDCQARYQSVTDYTCTFYKRERVDGHLTPLHIMNMKVRTKPQSIYLKFQRPAKGREAIYIAGQNGGKILAHDVGFNKILAGTLQLEPTSAQAMEDNRHPITEAGIGPLIETLLRSAGPLN